MVAVKPCTTTTNRPANPLNAGIWTSRKNPSLNLPLWFFSLNSLKQIYVLPKFFWTHIVYEVMSTLAVLLTQLLSQGY